MCRLEGNLELAGLFSGGASGWTGGEENASATLLKA